MNKSCPNNLRGVVAIFFAILFTSIFLNAKVLPVFANETFNFQGKVVRNDAGNEGLNVTTGSPTCVVLGVTNDTCDFRVEYYTAASAGTLLGSEVFSNVEIGNFNGIFNLALGTGSFTAGSESSFRNIFINNTAVYMEVDFAPDGSTFTETFLNSAGNRMQVRASPYAISASAAAKQFQFDSLASATGSGYSNVAAGQVYYDGTNDVLRVYNGSNWLAVQATLSNLPNLWDVNETPTPDVIYSYAGLDVAFGGTDSSAPFFYDVSAELLTLTNTTSGASFRVNDSSGDTTPFIIDASGQVGIGTPTPGQKLEVSGGRTLLKAASEAYALGLGRTDGAGSIWLGVNSSATPDLYISNNAGTARMIVSDSGNVTQIGANDAEIAYTLRKASVDSTHIQWQLAHQTNNKDLWIKAYDGTTTKNFVKFDFDNGITNFDTGRVGIGVSSPSAWLAIRAATSSYASLNLASSAATNPSAPTSGDLWWNGTNLYFFDGSTNQDLLVGGGPGGGLFTDGGAVTYLTSLTDDLALGGTDSTAPFFFDESAELLILTNTTAGLSFRVNDEASDTTPFVIDADGNVGIGTTTPGGRLDIGGSTSTITNTTGDITINAASGTISFAGDSITNILNGTFSGDVVINGGQLQMGNHVSNPTSIGEGAVVYNSTDKILYYHNGTTWSGVGKVYTGTTGQTLRHNGTDWVANSALVNDGTNVTATGQVRVGNYASKPAGIGAGSLVYDTVLESLFVYDGTDWKAVSTAQTFTGEGVVADGSYLELVHGSNSFDLIASAWIKVGSLWKEAQNVSNDLMHTLNTHWNHADVDGVKRVDTRLTNLELAPGIDVGTGADGSITISSDTSINTTNSISGRSCADGGDAVNYSVSALTSTTATLESTPSAGCLAVGDEVLLINLRGATSAYGNVGNYETLDIFNISTNTITFSTPKTKYYGDGGSDDTNIGLTSSNQAVMLQRVPNYVNVTISGSGTDFYPDQWVQPTGSANNGGGEGGVMFFRSNGSVSVGSTNTINANGRGYIGGIVRGAYGGGNNAGRSGGDGGEAFCGAGGLGAVYANNGGNGAGGGGSGQDNTGGTGYCGGGGGGATGGTGSASLGGAGGGGNGYQGGGGGGGYGTFGYAGSGGANGATNGGTNTSGNGGSAVGSGGGGGGGTYGVADLSKMMFGSGGGKGVDYEVAGDNLGDGGNGGGIVFISTDALTVSGEIKSKGQDGEANTGGTYGGGGGGGAGGSVKIIGNTLTLGSSIVTAPGGTGGTGQGVNGGAGGSGRIAVYYSDSVSGTTSPTYDSTEVPYNSYGIYTSDVIPTTGASGYYNMRWTENLNTYGKISVQTRSGATSVSTDGSWEAWKPNTTTTNYLDLENTNTHTNWTGTNATVAEGDVTRNIDFFEDEDEATATNLTKITSSTAGGYAEATISATNLSGYDYVTAWVRASQSGNTLKLGVGEAAATEQEFDITVDAADVWQKVYWDISDITGTAIDAVTKLRFTNNPAVSNTIYIDNVRAEKLISNKNGSAISSTPNDYIQYRVIFTTTNLSYRPMLESIKFTWVNGYRIEMYDANTIRLHNESGSQQELKITASGASGSYGGGSNWTSSGGNVYRSSGYVGIGDTTPDVELKVVGAICAKSNAADCAGNTAGTIYANNTSVQSADVAEKYRVVDPSINEGDIVSLSSIGSGEIEKSTQGNVDKLLGAISTAPGLIMNDSKDEDMLPVGLIGRLPVKVISVGSGISKGDAITVSKIAGVGIKLKDSGYIVGRALEDTSDFSDQKCLPVSSVDDIVWPKDDGKNTLKSCFKVEVLTLPQEIREYLESEYFVDENEYIYVGKIMMYVDVMWSQPEWMTANLTQLAKDYDLGELGGDSYWNAQGDQLVTIKDVYANSFNGNRGYFNILSGAMLNIGDSGFVVDSGGNVDIAGDMLLSGRIKGKSGGLIVELGDSGGNSLFEIKNGVGDTVFSIDSKGTIGGKSAYRSEWVKVSGNSSQDFVHNFGSIPAIIDLRKSDSSSGNAYTTKGVGVDYYYESVDNNTIRVYNKTVNDIYVKLNLQR